MSILIKRSPAGRLRIIQYVFHGGITIQYQVRTNYWSLAAAGKDAIITPFQAAIIIGAARNTLAKTV